MDAPRPDPVRLPRPVASQGPPRDSGLQKLFLGPKKDPLHEITTQEKLFSFLYPIETIFLISGPR